MRSRILFVAAGLVVAGGVAGSGVVGSSLSAPVAGVFPDHAELVYLWSPTMPLSELGLPTIEEVGESLGVSVRAIRAEAWDEEVEPALAQALVAAGATIHYPTVTVLRSGQVEGTAIAGFKTGSAWRELLAERLASPAPAEVPVRPSEHEVAGAALQKIEVVWSHAVRPSPGAFFRHLPGTTLISFDQSRRVFLRDLESGRQFQGPGWIDFVPTPDGRLFVTPAQRDEGLEFYSVDEVLEAGEGGSAAGVARRFLDPALNDQYPSVGILETVGTDRVRYRIVVSWFRGVAFRDYEVVWDATGLPTVRALGEKREACPGLDLSTPILSKDGRELAARHQGTTRLFALDAEGGCREVHDFGVATSKVGFSQDGSRIAYSTIRERTESRTWVWDRATDQTVALPHSTSVGLVIPEVVGTDSVLISVRPERRTPGSEFRLLCCVR